MAKQCTHGITGHYWMLPASSLRVRRSTGQRPASIFSTASD
jgi:hypothetical protein